MNRAKRHILYYMIGTIVLVFFDQLTKQLALFFLKGTEGISIIPNIFRLYYLENQGAAFSLLEGHQWFFIVITSIVLILGFFLYCNMPKDTKYKPINWIIILFTAGGIGNLIDRCLYRYVIDFFYFELIDFPVFNVADIYVVVAAALLIFLFLFYYKEQEIDELSKQLKHNLKHKEGV